MDEWMNIRQLYSS